MKLARGVLFLAGLAGLGWGAALLVEFAVPAPEEAVVAAGWLLGGPLVHDLVIAPACGLAGLAVARHVPARWRAPLIAGLVLTAILALLALPLLWRAYGAPPLPGLHDHDPVPGLLIALAAGWVTVVIIGLLRWRGSHSATGSGGRGRRSTVDGDLPQSGSR